MKKTMRVVMVEPGKFAKVTEIGTELKDLQEAVGGGYIEAFYPFEDFDVCVVCNDEGKINGMDPNRGVTNDKGELFDIIFGPFFICDCSEEEFASLPPEKMEKYKEMFYKPERFVKIGKNIEAIKFDKEW